MNHYSNIPNRSNYTLSEQRENRRKLAQALRSGDYEPLVVNARFNQDGLSPAAIACEVSCLFGSDDWTEHTLPDLPTNVQDWLGFRTPAGEFREGDENRSQRSLMEAGEFEFNEIADLLDAPPDGLVSAQETMSTWKWEQLEDGLWEIAPGPGRERHAQYLVRRRGDGNFETSIITRTVTKHQTLEQAVRTAHLHAQQHQRSRTRHILGDQEVIT